MRVLMLGWEFPPYMSGGLGTACYGITKALLKRGADVLFVLPKADMPEHPLSHVKLRSASGTLIPHQRFVSKDENLISRLEHDFVSSLTAADFHERLSDVWEKKLSIRHVDSLLFPYDTCESYEERLCETLCRKTAVSAPTQKKSAGPVELVKELKSRQSSRSDITEYMEKVALHGGYGKDLMSEVYRYSCAAAVIALREDFDVIHAHDWMTYPAAMLVKELTGKPLITHIHALEHDRSGDSVNPEVSHIEWAGMNAADRVVAVSHYTKREVMKQYRIPEGKIEVVHNAVNREESSGVYHLNIPPHKEKRVLFMGRITYQKGPDYFVEAARLVHEQMPSVRFVMAGSGDMFSRMVRRVAQLRMGTIFHFPGFQTGENIERMYASCDLYVMPSVSEPFGIAPLEAMIYDVPVILSRQSGVSEVVHNALKVDFWDVREMANKICAVLRYPALAAEMVKNSREELKTIRWENAADRLMSIYDDCVKGGA